MNRRDCLTVACICLGASAIRAQEGLLSGISNAPLPMRNLLIEVRQVQGEDGQRADVGVQGGRVTGTLS